MKKYLIVAELNNIGYIIGLTKSFKNAEKKLTELVDLSCKYHFHEIEKLHEDLKSYRNYKINGNELYFANCKISSSNGAYTVSIIEIDLATFSLEMFIHERRFSSLAFGYEDKLENYQSQIRAN